jgi:hypothetical protein
MQSSFVVGLSASYTKKIFAQGGCTAKLNLVELRNFNSKANYARLFFGRAGDFACVPCVLLG